MRELPDKCVDLVLTDPPYGIGESLKQRHKNAKPCKTWKTRSPKTWKGYEKATWDRHRLEYSFFSEIFRISKEQIIFGGNYYIDFLKPGPSWIVWDKKNSDTDFADCELAWTSHNRAVRKFDWLWSGYKKENPEKRYHPTQKPIPLFEWILKNYSEPGDIVLDPFLGSGTTLRACRETGRIGLGFEINPDYEPIIRKRMMEDIPKIDEWF